MGLIPRGWYACTSKGTEIDFGTLHQRQAAQVSQADAIKTKRQKLGDMGGLRD